MIAELVLPFIGMFLLGMQFQYFLIQKENEKKTGVIKMSGGSLNYLYAKTEINRITDSLNDIQLLMDVLKEMQYDDIAKDVHDLYDFCLKAEIEVLERVEKLQEVVHDVEWYLSDDIGKERLERTCQKYRQLNVVKKGQQKR